METLEVRKLKAFGTQIQTAAARDLKLLQAIETTLESLDVRCMFLQQLNKAADEFIRRFSEDKLELPAQGSKVDLVALFEQVRDLVETAYEKVTTKQLCAIGAPELHDDDGVVDAYALLLTEIAALHEKLNTLTWLIREQEADQDKVAPGEFLNADELFAAMGV